jgi:hypothetical protein
LEIFLKIEKVTIELKNAKNDQKMKKMTKKWEKWRKKHEKYDNHKKSLYLGNWKKMIEL